jgi:hypothetical protein
MSGLDQDIQIVAPDDRGAPWVSAVDNAAQLAIDLIRESGVDLGETVQTAALFAALGAEEAAKQTLYPDVAGSLLSMRRGVYRAAPVRDVIVRLLQEMSK